MGRDGEQLDALVRRGSEILQERAPLRDIAGDLGEADELTVSVSQGGDDDVRPEPGAVLADPPPLVLEPAVGHRPPQLLVRPAAGDHLRLELAGCYGAMAEAAINLLLHKIRRQKDRHVTQAVDHLVPYVLVRRDSVAPPRRP